MRYIKFCNDEYYHVYSRGVDKRHVFIDDQDFKRFQDKLELLSCYKGRRLVELSAYCLMDNHYHLILKQVVDDGISTYMHRLGASHTLYFNKRHMRSGRLFETTFKARHANNDAYLAHLVRYLHINPLEKIFSSKKINPRTVLDELRRYRWSDCASYLDGSGDLLWLFDDVSYEDFMMQWIRWRLGELSSLELSSELRTTRLEPLLGLL